jgi:hypothetical protein
LMKKGNSVSATVIYKFIFCALTYACLAALSSSAQTDPAEEETAFYRSRHYIPIKGEQESDYPKGVYLVTDDVVIKKGRTMTFMPGTLVLLKKDTRITVEGRLICQGNPKAAITFAKLENDKYLIPLDAGVDARWDGIFITDSGSVEISYTVITGSKYGVENDLANGTILLDTVMFKDNKFQNLKVSGNLICVQEGKFVFYSSRTSGVQGGIKNSGVISSGNANKPKNWILPVRIGCGALALAGGGLYVTELIVAGNFQKKSDDAENSGDAENYYNKAKSAAAAGNAGGILAILGAIGFSVTFFF